MRLETWRCRIELELEKSICRALQSYKLRDGFETVDRRLVFCFVGKGGEDTYNRNPTMKIRRLG